MLRRMYSRPMYAIPVLATLAVGCTDALIIYPIGDGGVDASGPSTRCIDDDDECIGLGDATVPWHVSTPQWFDGLRGRYAMRVRYYGQLPSGQVTARVASEAIWLVDLVPQRERPTIEVTELCAEQTTVTPPAPLAPYTTSLIYPNAYPDITYTLRHENEEWSATKNETLIGYTGAVVGCERAETMESQPVHTWITSGVCQCVNSDAPPTTVDDCRLFDPDNDKTPGMSFRVSGAMTGVDWVVTSDRSELLHGKVEPSSGFPRRLSAQYSYNTNVSRLRCAGRTCEPAALRACRMENNVVDLVQIRDGTSGYARWGCQEILDARTQPDFFPARADAFPEGC